MKPVFVHIHWSEAGGELAEDAILDFHKFEAIALAEAEAHKTGGYLKTKVTVHFDEGSTYECRLDLGAGPNLEKGFRDAIEKRIAYQLSAEGQQRLNEGPKAMADDQRVYFEIWQTMDFGPDRTWCSWEIQDLSQPVDQSFCTLTVRN